MMEINRHMTAFAALATRNTNLTPPNMVWWDEKAAGNNTSSHRLSLIDVREEVGRVLNKEYSKSFNDQPEIFNEAILRIHAKELDIFNQAALKARSEVKDIINRSALIACEKALASFDDEISKAGVESQSRVPLIDTPKTKWTGWRATGIIGGPLIVLSWIASVTGRMLGIR